MLTKKYFDDWLEDLENQYQVLSVPQVSLLDAFISGSNYNRDYLAIGGIIGEITRVRALKDELERKGLLK